MRVVIYRLLICCSFLSVNPAVSEQSVQSPAVLPDPLPFEVALSLADDALHFDYLKTQGQLANADADVLAASGITDFNIELNLLAQYGEPSFRTPDDSLDDHQAAITVSKTLSDFGLSEGLTDAARRRLQAAEYLLESIKLKRRLDIARRFFDVDVADLQFSFDNEAISTAFINFDKTKDRNEVGQVSDVELLKAEYEYQQVRIQRYQSEADQRISRARLAEALARPKDLPAKVVIPDLAFIQRERPEFENLLKQAMENNLQLKAQREIVAAAHSELEAARHQGNSTLSAELEVAEYSRESIARNNWRAALRLKVPLYDNESYQAARGSAYANWQQQQAILQQLEADIRQQLLEAWQQLYVLAAALDIGRVGLDYRELYQDRSRAFYEMEYSTDLGDSFVQLTGVRLMQAKTQYDLAIAWMKLAVLTGQRPEEFIKQ